MIEPDGQSTAQARRYARQVILPGFGEPGQAMLRQSCVAIVGVGALGCVCADLLARAGVGQLMLIDRDVVEWSNLHRQSLYEEDDARRGVPKVEAAAARLSRVNADVVIDARATDLHSRNAERVLNLIGSAVRPRIIIDGTDNFETRFLLNDVCVKHALPFAYAGAVGTRGMQATFLPGGACLRCLFDAPPSPGTVETCESTGVLAPAAAIVASAQAMDVLKVLLQRFDRLSSSLLEIDLWENTRRRIDLRAARRGDCPACGSRRFEHLDGSRRVEAAELCGQHAVQVAPRADTMLDLVTLAARLAPLGDVTRTRSMLRFAPVEQHGITMSVFADGRTIVHGTSDTSRARALCARYIGA